MQNLKLYNFGVCVWTQVRNNENEICNFPLYEVFYIVTCQIYKQCPKVGK